MMTINGGDRMTMGDEMRPTMNIDEQVMSDLLDLEWEMFHSVQGIDGPSACQQDRRTFEIMRSSQLRGWSNEVAESYLDDLRQAKAQGRNLMTEKYARMMEYTSPCEYRRIAPSLSMLEPEAESLVERILQMSVRWMEEVAAKFPYVGAQGRSIRSSGDTVHSPSFETYTRGELATYSLKTLRLLERHCVHMADVGKNPAEVILRHTVAQYGYPSLERAEAAQKARAERVTE